jgi:integrase
MFEWGMKAGLVSANPVAVTFKPTEERPRERVLLDTELARIWACTGDSDYDRIVRILLLTGARRQEVSGIRRHEIDRHPDGSATWVLPSERSKNRLPHELILPPMIAALLPEGQDDDQDVPRELLFGRGRGPFSGWSKCKERLDARLATANGGTAMTSWVLHDLRRTFVTRLNDLGVEPHVIEALVNHVTGVAKNGVAGVYNRSAYGVQKRVALSLWCDHIAALVGEQGAQDGQFVALGHA